MTIVTVGSNQSYSNNWEQIFSGKKTKSSIAKKTAKKKAAVKTAKPAAAPKKKASKKAAKKK